MFREHQRTVANTPVLKLVGVPIGVRRRNPRSNVSQRPRDREDCKLTELGEALAQEWERIAAAGTRLHEAYTAGMSRLSCRFCVLSSRADLVCSARLNPDLADRYAEVERRIGHRFRTDLTMADVIAEAHGAGQLALIPLADIA